MTRCEFALYTKSKSCTACSGWHCTSLGRRKKIGDLSLCNDDDLWSICTRYLKVYPEQDPLPATPPKTVAETLETEPTTYFDLPEIDDTPFIGDTGDLESAFSWSPTINVLSEPEPPPPPPPKPRPKNPQCPYLGSPPRGEKTCCGAYCYAERIPLRSVKKCNSRPSWVECQRRVSAARQRVPHASS